MDETMEASYEDFFGSFDDGYQTETETETESEAQEQTTEEPVTDNPEQEETTEAKEESGAEAEQKPDGANDEAQTEQSFQIKVNHEERTVSLEEMKALAQKGADYDRVKNQSDELRNFRDSYKDLVDTVTRVAEKNGTKVADIVTMFRKNLLKADGVPEAALDDRIKAEDAEAKLRDYAAKAEAEKQEAEDNAQRAKREVQEFQGRFPGVALDKATIDKLRPFLDGGKRSLTDAYQEMRFKEQSEKIAQLEQQLNASKQNAKNAKAPGSMKDAGTAPKTQYDDFWGAFG